MVNPTWEERDLPVLRAVVQLCEESGSSAKLGRIAEECKFDKATVRRALVALDNEHPRLFKKLDGSASSDSLMVVFGPTGEARRRVGLWPTPESFADRLVEALEQAAEREPDTEKKGWLKKTADYLGTAGRDIAVDVAAAVITRQIGT